MCPELFFPNFCVMLQLGLRHATLEEEGEE